MTEDKSPSPYITGSTTGFDCVIHTYMKQSKQLANQFDSMYEMLFFVRIIYQEQMASMEIAVILVNIVLRDRSVKLTVRQEV